MNASRWVVVSLSFGVGAVLALSCASATDEGPLGPYTPASSAERALAKAERAARQKVLDEQKPKDAGTSEEPPAPVPEPVPEPIPEPVASVEPEPVDAGPAPSASAAVEVEPPPDTTGLCTKVCDRTMACAKERFAGMPGGAALLQEMLKQVKADCLDQCAKKSKKATAAQVKEAEACLASKDCTAFQSCMEALQKSLGDDAEK